MPNTSPNSSILNLQWLVQASARDILQYLFLLLLEDLQGIMDINCSSLQPSLSSRWIWMLVGFAIIPYPISIHGQTYDLINLVQQYVLSDIVFYAPHHLFFKSSKQFHWVHLAPNDMCNKLNKIQWWGRPSCKYSNHSELIYLFWSAYSSIPLLRNPTNTQ